MSLNSINKKIASKFFVSIFLQIADSIDIPNKDSCGSYFLEDNKGNNDNDQAISQTNIGKRI